MVLLSGARKEGRESRSPTAEKQLQAGSLRVPGAERGRSPGGSGKIDPTIPAERARREGQGEEEEEEEEWDDKEEDEEYEDFSDLPDTRSIASDDSFYPPQETDDEDELELSDSKQQLSLFRACCTNNAAVVRTLIRQGLQEEDVRETDRNKQVRAQRLALPGLGEGGKGKQTGAVLRRAGSFPSIDPLVAPHSYCNISLER
ncbi:hypothetical protein E2320_010982 [Naja naja]|nr:hypothetical protein E2320_010982 [Naja naja]